MKFKIETEVYSTHCLEEIKEKIKIGFAVLQIHQFKENATVVTYIKTSNRRSVTVKIIPEKFNEWADEKNISSGMIKLDLLKSARVYFPRLSAHMFTKFMIKYFEKKQIIYETDKSNSIEYIVLRAV